MRRHQTAKRKVWFWCIISEITIKKSAVKSTRPIGEVWENLILIHAVDESEAYKKAMAIGKEVEGDSYGSLRLDGSPAKKLFLGVQQIGLLTDDEPGDGREILFWSKRETLEKAKSKIRGKARLASLAEVIERKRRVEQMSPDQLVAPPPPPRRAKS